MSTNTNSRSISVKEAQLKTATVEIKSLVVSGKQVTMGVFRQLEIEDLVDPETAELRGLPWGRVNYFPKPCDPNHLHIVWQKGSELKRACVYRKIDKHLTWEYREDLEDLEKLIQPAAMLCLIDEVVANKPEPIEKDQKSYKWEHDGCRTGVRLLEGTLCLSWSTALDTWLKTPSDELPNRYGGREQLTADLSKLRKNQAEKIGTSSYDEAALIAVKSIRDYCDIQRKWKQHIEKHERHYAELEALDQLFIAV